MPPLKKVEYTLAKATTRIDCPPDEHSNQTELKLKNHIEDTPADEFEFEYIDVYTLAIVDNSNKREHYEYLLTDVIDHEYEQSTEEVTVTRKDGSTDVFKNCFVLSEQYADHTINELHDKSRYIP